MNLIALAPLWLIWLLFAALIAAAVEDGIRLRISDWIPAIVLLGAIAAMFLAGPSISLWQNLLSFAIVLVLGTAAFSAGIFGGGDVKLLSAIALWVDLRSGFMLVTIILLAGAALAIIHLLPAMVSGRALRSVRATRIPYGIAIAAGVVVSMGLFRDIEHPKHQPWALPKSITSRATVH